MARAHFSRPVLDEMGNLVADIVVRVIDPESNANLADVYPNALGDTPLEQPISFANGIIDFYLPESRRVRLGVKKGVAAEVFFEDIDVLNTDDKGNATTLGGAPPLVNPGRIPGDRHIDIETDPAVRAEYVLIDGSWVPLSATAAGVSFTPTATLLDEDVQAALTTLDGLAEPLRALEPGDVLLTKEEADAAYAPKPIDEPGQADPETGETGTTATTFSIQTVVAGDLAVSPNIVKPGLRVVQAGVAHTMIARVDAAPVGGPITIVGRRYNAGVYADDIGTVTIPDGSALGFAVGLTRACAKGDIIKFEVTSVGTTTPGADINLSVDFK